MNKPFDQKIYDQDDPIAKAAVQAYLERRFHPWWAMTMPEDFGPDIAWFPRGGKAWWIEAERKHGWNRNLFPFDTLHIPFRKERLIEYAPITFYVVSMNLRWAMTVEGADLFRCLPPIHKKTIYTDDEEFYSVPLKLCRLEEIG